MATSKIEMIIRDYYDQTMCKQIGYPRRNK